MPNFRSCSLLAVSSLYVLGSPASAQAIHNGPISTQTTQFDKAVAANGGVVHLDSLSSLQPGSNWMRPGYEISSTSNTLHTIATSYLNSGVNTGLKPIGGEGIDLYPQAPAALSGLTFTFDKPVNAFGLEVGDWATCCFPSSLYIAFDGGATMKVATAYADADNPGIPARDWYRNFVGAIDSSATFSKVSFYGDGVGEYLVAGGTIRFGTVEIASVPNPGAVPEPSTWLMMICGFAAVGFAMRHRATTRATRPYPCRSHGYRPTLPPCATEPACSANLTRSSVLPLG